MFMPLKEIDGSPSVANSEATKSLMKKKQKSDKSLIANEFAETKEISYEDAAKMVVPASSSEGTMQLA